MCDPESIIGNMIGGIGPGRPSPDFVGPVRPTLGQKFSGLSDVFGAGKAIFGAVQAGSTATKASEASGRRTAQVEFDAAIRSDQTSQAQDRRLGGQRAAFAKSGIKATGTAKRLLEEQIKQDEIELLKITHNKDISIGEERESVRRARLQGAATATQSITGGINDLFGLSK